MPLELTLQNHAGFFAKQDVQSVLVEEKCGYPLRFEVWLEDPRGEAYKAAQGLLGDTLSLSDESDGRLIARGRIWKRRHVRNGHTGLIATVLLGFDQTYSLTRQARLRSLGPTSFTDLAKSACQAFSVSTEIGMQTGRWSDSDAYFVQYNETDWAFLRRHARLHGHDLWSWQGKLFIGPGPGATERPLNVDVADPTLGLAELMFEENWCREPAAQIVPAGGAPFLGYPKLDEVESQPHYIMERQEPLASPIGDLLAGSFQRWPIGLAKDAQEANEIGMAQFRIWRDQRHLGVISVASPLGWNAVLGQKVTVCHGRDVLCKDAIVAGRRQTFKGSSRVATLYLGQHPATQPQPPLERPAFRLHLGRIKGEFLAERGKYPVLPFGWDQDSVPIPARALTFAAEAGLRTMRGYNPGEFVVFGFEEGNPDAPVILGSIFDGTAPSVEVGPGQAIWTLESENGTLKVQLKDGKVEVQLVDLDLVLEGNQCLSLTGNESIAMKANSITMDKP